MFIVLLSAPPRSVCAHRRPFKKREGTESCAGMRRRLGAVIARLEGFEPTTPGSEDRCSCPLSYRRRIKWGERWDLNPRSPGPQPGALTARLRSPQPRILYCTTPTAFNVGSGRLAVAAPGSEPTRALRTQALVSLRPLIHHTSHVCLRHHVGIVHKGLPRFVLAFWSFAVGRSQAMQSQRTCYNCLALKCWPSTRYENLPADL